MILSPLSPFERPEGCVEEYTLAFELDRLEILVGLGNVVADFLTLIF